MKYTSNYQEKPLKLEPYFQFNQKYCKIGSIIPIKEYPECTNEKNT
ncbi:MAG: hypothetical protein GXY89_01840 [Tissierellia bacterium]|nr:hypothetical protein [Tissierellia bacterium]